MKKCLMWIELNNYTKIFRAFNQKTDLQKYTSPFRLKESLFSRKGLAGSVVSQFPIRLNTEFGSWLACESIDVPDWLSIWYLTKSIIVEAISASRSLESAAVRLAVYVVRSVIVCSRALEYEPIFARCEDMALIARSRMLTEREAFSRVRTLTRDRPSAEAEESPSSSMKSSPEFAPV